MANHTKTIPQTNPLAAYMTGQAFWFVAQGIQMVIFQAIGALVLNLSASQLGIVQAATMIPALLLVLPAGLIADRHDGRTILIIMQSAAVLPALTLGTLVLAREIEFLHLIFFAFIIGGIGSFVMPTRDALLSHMVDARHIQRAVNIALGLQFTSMLTGMIIVAGADFVDIGWMPIIQSAIFILAATAAFFLPRHLEKMEKFDKRPSLTLTDMMDGIRFAFTHRDITPVLLLQSGISVFYIGLFLVILPLLVRDYYNGSTADIALVNILFWCGTIISTIALLRIGLIASVGRLLVGGVSVGLVVVGAFALPMPFWTLNILCVIWGIAAGVSMSSGRTIIQNRAPDSHRARILSVYQLSFMGGAPFGALFTGFLADVAGIHTAPLFSLVGMGALILATVAFTRILSISLSREELENVEETTRIIPDDEEEEEGGRHE